MLKTSRLTPQFQFDPRTQRFIGSDKRFVARETVKAACEALVTQCQNDISEVSQRFQNGEISHADWDSAMRHNIRRLTVTQTALAVGGWDNMTQAHYGRAGNLTREQFKYLNGMGERIQSGYYGAELERNGFLNHAQSYGQSGRGTFEVVQGMNAIEALGHDEICNVPHEAEKNCKGENSCRAMTDLGWIKIDSDVFKRQWLWPTNRLCVNQCRCRTKTRKSRVL